jgi:hypothetical protein
VRLAVALALITVLSLTACRHAFVERARCAEDLRDYEDRLRLERDTLAQARVIATADSDAIVAGRGLKQRRVIHDLLTYSARSRLAPRGARTGNIAEFVCADTSQ